jgi:mono/diheme cytochrome c family protein
LAWLIVIAISACQAEEPTLSECLPPEQCGALTLDPSQQIFTAVGGNADKGRDIYASQCAGCHGANGLGLGPAAGVSFQRDSWHSRTTDNQIRLVIRKGRGSQMPAFDLEDDAIRDVIAHLRSLAKHQDGSPRKYGL